MNKKLKFIIAGFAVVAGLASAVSCQDLSKDVDSLSKEVASLKTLVNDLQTKINAGAVITNVASTSTGIEITLSDGKKYTVSNGKDGANGTNGTNGKDGTPGSVITIGDNGNWFIDGVDTGKAAVGQAGAAGKDGDSIYWDLSADGKKFVEYKNGVATGKEVAIPAAQGAVTAKWDAEKGILTIYGAEGSEEGLPIVLTNNAEAVAAVSLVDSKGGYYIDLETGNFTNAQGRYSGYYRYFPVIEEKDNIFGSGLENEMVFKEGRQTIDAQSLVIRVSPANYEPKPEDICFINSLGMVFDGMDVTKVEPFTELITKSVTATGLYKIYFKPEKVDDDFWTNAFVLDEDGDLYEYINFAVKIQDAVSTFDVSFGAYDFTPEGYLDLAIGGVARENNIWNFNNRPLDAYTRSTKAWNDRGGYAEMEWLYDDEDYRYIPDVAPITEGDDKNVNISDYNNDEGTGTNYDSRGGNALYNAVLDEAITIYATGSWNGETYDLAENVKGMYVTLDNVKNAIESAPSEWNAWKLYEPQIEGLNKVVEDNKVTITIKDPRADGDVIGFRVYAVNLDGTLVDPDGRAFYVQLGKTAKPLSTINTIISTEEEINAKTSARVSVTGENVGIVSYVSLEMDDPNAPTFLPTLLDKNGNPLNVSGWNPLDYSEYEPDITTQDMKEGYYYSFNPKDIAKVYTKANYDADDDGTVDLWAYEDDVTYYATLTFFDDNQRILATQQISFTKNLPTSVPEIPIKTSQLGADGKYRCFLVPKNMTAYDSVEKAFEANQTGTIDMLSIFNFPKDDPNGYVVTFADAKYTYEDEDLPAWDERKKKDGKFVMDDIIVTPTKKLSEDPDLDAEENQLKLIDIDLIDSKTEHKTTVAKNYGKVSSKKVILNEDKTVKEVLDYTVTATSFKTIFFCIYNDDANYGWPWSWDSSAAWANTDAIAGSAKIAKNVNKLSVVYENFDGGTLPATKIKGQSKWDSLYKGTMPNGYDTYGNTIKVQGVKLVTKSGDNAGEEEYYTVDTDFKFTKKSGATNPTTAVPSELLVTFTDMYGHENVAQLEAEVLKR